MADLVPPFQPGNGVWSWYYFGSDWAAVRSGSGSNEPLSAGEIVGLSFSFSGQFFIVQGFIAFGLGQFDLDEISSLSLRLEVDYNDLPIAQEMVVRSYTDWSYNLAAGDFVPAEDLSGLLEVGSVILDPQTSGTVDIPIDLSVLTEVYEGTIGLLLHPRLQEDASPPGAQHDDALAFDASASFLVVSDDPGDHQAGAGDVTSIARIDGAGHAPPLVVPTGSGSIDAAGALDAEGHTATAGAGQAEATGTLDGAGHAPALDIPSGSGSVGADGEMFGAGHTDRAGAGQLDGTATVDGHGAAVTSGSGTLDTVGTLDATGTTATSGAGHLDTAGTLTGTGEAREATTGSGTITTTGTLDGAGHVSHTGTGHLDSTGVLDGAGQADHTGTGQTVTVGTIVGR